ncbi:hypothetical protein ACIP2X_36515 [Streptomyces sp. NPDC089424]|uniref:hypothetical protein n=1 Tax=Streptomyces sp. NPDC089424 TaxID=3365917 RepID=UPI0038053CBF
MSAIRLWRGVRRADGPLAVTVGVVNPLVCCGLLLMTIGGVLGAEVTTGAQENAAEGLALRLFVYWLAGGMLLFAALALWRTLLTHLATLVLTPTVVLGLAVLVSR